MSRQREYTVELKTCTCDACKRRALGAEVLCDGTPVLFECAVCSPNPFREAAEELAGRAIADALGWS